MKEKSAVDGDAEFEVRIGMSVVINLPVEEVFRFWRNFENLPLFMHHLKSVKVLDEKRSRWVARAPLRQSVTWEAEITDEKENEYISWRSLDGSEVQHGGSVRFKTALDDKGTDVTVILGYNPPGGEIGRHFAMLFGEEPAQQIEEDLFHFKQMMENRFE